MTKRGNTGSVTSPDSLLNDMYDPGLLTDFSKSISGYYYDVKVYGPQCDVVKSYARAAISENGNSVLVRVDGLSMITFERNTDEEGDFYVDVDDQGHAYDLFINRSMDGLSMEVTLKRIPEETGECTKAYVFRRSLAAVGVYLPPVPTMYGIYGYGTQTSGGIYGNVPAPVNPTNPNSTSGSATNGDKKVYDLQFGYRHSDPQFGWPYGWYDAGYGFDVTVHYERDKNEKGWLQKVLDYARERREERRAEREENNDDDPDQDDEE